MSNKLELQGQTFGRLCVIGEVLDYRRGGLIHWWCKCECGEMAIIAGRSLKNGHTKSCSCLNKDRSAEANKKRWASLTEEQKNQWAETRRQSQLGFKHTEKTKHLLSIQSKGRMLGYKPSAKTRALLSKARTGKKHTEATKQLLRKIRTGFMMGSDHPNWKGDNFPREYPSGWLSLRDEIRKRDSYKCQLCGAPQMECFRKLDVHHKDGNKHNLRPDNLVSLCMRCHRQLEGKRIRKKKVKRSIC